MKKRLLSLLLALTLTFVLLPPAALALNCVEIVPPKYDGISEFYEGLAVVKLNNKWGFIDKTGEEILPLIYDEASPFSDGLAVVRQGEKLFVIDKSGKEIFPIHYEAISSMGFREGLVVVKKDGKCGYMDKTGKLVIPATFSWAADFSEGLAQIEQNGKYGFIDKYGKVVIPATFYEAYKFSQGVAQIRYSFIGPYGLIDKSGKVLVSPKYEEIREFSEDMAAVRLENDHWGYIDKAGKEVISPVYNFVGDFSEGLAAVRLEDGSYSYIDKTGKAILQHLSWAGDFSGGLALVKQGDNYGFIDTSGMTQLLPNEPNDYRNVNSLSGGLAVFESWGMEYGLIDQYGNEVISPHYSHVENFSGGVVRVESFDDKFGLLALTAEPLSAIPTTSKVLVNGEEQAFDAYTINGNNYIKLRDIAMILSGTDKQINVTWDSEKEAVNLISNAAYTPVGGELTKSNGKTKTADWNTSKIYLDGKQIAMTACSIGGNNYFKLRDLGMQFDFYVGWDGSVGTVTIDTTAGYDWPISPGMGG